MAAYPKILTTYEGLSLISAAAAATAPITITKVMLGDGELGETDQRSLTELISPKLELSLTGIEDLGNGQFQVRAAASNSGLATGFFAREVGVYAKYSDASGEKLIAYTNGGNYVDYIPDESTPIDSQIFKIDVVIGDASEVTINVKDEAYLTAAELEEHNTSSAAHADIRAALDEAVTDVTYSSGTLTVEKGDGSSTTASINPVTSVSVSGTTATVSKADGTSSTFTVPEGTTAVTESYRSGRNGYLIFSNGTMIEWGEITDLENGVAKIYTLPRAFANTQYAVLGWRPGQVTSLGQTTFITSFNRASSTQVSAVIVAASQEVLTSWDVDFICIGQAAT